MLSRKRLKEESAVLPLFVVSLSLAVGANDAREDLNALNLEVAALQQLHQLDVTPAQLEALAKLAKDAAPKTGERKPAKVSDKYRRTLLQYREALVKGEDERADDLGEELEDLRYSEAPTLDDAIDTADEARKLAPQALKLLGARQTATYLGLYGDDLPDPVEELLAALEKSHGTDDKEWKELRDATAEDVGWLLAGLDAGEAGKVGDKVTALLDRAHGLKNVEYQAQKADLEKAARELADVEPTVVLRHVMQRDLAELLSNPQLTTAIEARLKQVKK
jgi:hypothetical protein